MIKKPWTPETCLLQVGSVVHNNIRRTDYIVLGRRLIGSSATSDMVMIPYDNNHTHWLNGEALANGVWSYYPNWPDTSVTKPCCLEVEEEPESKEYVTDTEFIQAVFDAAKKLPGASKLFETSEHGTSVWDDDAHAIIQENALYIAEELKKLVEE